MPEDNRPALRIMLTFLLLLMLSASAPAQVTSINELIKVTPLPGDGFKWPYYLYIPTQSLSSSDTATILVQPNNTGKVTDDFSVHDADAMRDANKLRALCDEIHLIGLVPAFPRPRSNWRIYTHALDRDAIVTDDSLLKRLDLQLIAMFDNARQLLARRNLIVDQRVQLLGFSASGMFANRFAILHPKLVKAVACGSPGGWPIAPLCAWKGDSLRYPVGIADLAQITGAPFDSADFAGLPLFLFMGDRDTNDAVAYEDGFDIPDRDLINRLFGNTPVSRWPAGEAIYRSVDPACQIKLYDGVGHEITAAMWEDIRAFLKAHK
jgi:pimeloyl-ACP methyl ester carboxylesterase